MSTVSSPSVRFNDQGDLTGLAVRGGFPDESVLDREFEWPADADRFMREMALEQAISTANDNLRAQLMEARDLLRSAVPDAHAIAVHQLVKLMEFAGRDEVKTDYTAVLMPTASTSFCVIAATPLDAARGALAKMLGRTVNAA